MLGPAIRGSASDRGVSLTNAQPVGLHRLGIVVPLFRIRRDGRAFHAPRPIKSRRGRPVRPLAWSRQPGSTSPMLATRAGWCRGRRAVPSGTASMHPGSRAPALSDVARLRTWAGHTIAFDGAGGIEPSIASTTSRSPRIKILGLSEGSRSGAGRTGPDRFCLCKRFVCASPRRPRFRRPAGLSRPALSKRRRSARPPPCSSPKGGRSPAPPISGHYPCGVMPGAADSRASGSRRGDRTFGARRQPESIVWRRIRMVHRRESDRTARRRRHGAGVIAGGSHPLPSRMPVIWAGCGARSRQMTSKPAPAGVGSQFCACAGFVGSVLCR
jgi:hypothetical protein